MMTMTMKMTMQGCAAISNDNDNDHALAQASDDDNDNDHALAQASDASAFTHAQQQRAGLAPHKLFTWNSWSPSTNLDPDLQTSPWTRGPGP